jgi:hypothetical protein
MPNISQSADTTEHWRAHLKAWRESGLNQTRYCATHGLTPFTFSYWKKKLGAPAGGGLVEIKPQVQSSTPRAPLLEVRISESFDLSFNLHLSGALLERLFGGDVSGR